MTREKYPVEMSGGMRQRTAIARAPAMQPDMIYFDEPFTALDVALKRRMQDLVIAASRDASFSALFITHDLMEAVRIAHRVAVKGWPETRPAYPAVTCWPGRCWQTASRRPAWPCPDASPPWPCPRWPAFRLPPCRPCPCRNAACI